VTRFKRRQDCAKLIIAQQAVTLCLPTSSHTAIPHKDPLRTINVATFDGASLLALQYGVPHKELTDPFRYLDLSYLDRAALPPK